MFDHLDPRSAASHPEGSARRATGARGLIRSPRVAEHRRRALAFALGAGLLQACRVQAAASSPAALANAADATALTIRFRGIDFRHRWSKAQQHEFTPSDQPDLASWRDMITLNGHSAVTRGEQLAEVANQVLANYQRHGRILQTRSEPRTSVRPAEHLIVAVLGQPAFLEAAFARCLLTEGTGMVAVYSHRVYGKAAGPAMSEWLVAHGLPVEQAWMAWDSMPGGADLKRLPLALR